MLGRFGVICQPPPGTGLPAFDSRAECTTSAVRLTARERRGYTPMRAASGTTRRRKGSEMAGTTLVTEEIRAQIVSLVRDFVRRDVAPVASRYDHEDTYPAELVATMREMGLFGITIPEEYGGLGLDHATLAVIFEELSRGWMSVSGVIGTHHLAASIIADHGTVEQKERLLPRMARGEVHAGLGLTEPEAGSDVQNISTSAVRDGEEYVLNGSKMFITNAENGNAFAVLAKTDPGADPPYRGMSCFIVEKPNSGPDRWAPHRQAGLPRARHGGAAVRGLQGRRGEPWSVGSRAAGSGR